ncbi:HIRAN domain-containing protein [Viridibacterium curvum]|uniref:HIRAN domain-containing protein n=1 Tax=Viridibacterium curvum TaxID=1101404 RepID=A0ABP9R305_9RHOO
MAARRLLRQLSLGALLCYAALHAGAASRLLLQRVSVAGVAYHEAKAVWPRLREGDALEVVRDASNPHDPLAVRVDWQGHVLGYLPRELSGPVASALDKGMPITARIVRLRDHPNPRERIHIEIFASLQP